VPRFIEIPPVSKENSHHAKYDGRPDGRRTTRKHDAVRRRHKIKGSLKEAGTSVKWLSYAYKNFNESKYVHLKIVKLTSIGQDNHMAAC